MKKTYSILITIALVFTLCWWYYDTQAKERKLVILSTNDIHSSIDNFPRLATAVRECRDTISTIVVDAGDRWTGNPYVDIAEGRKPILDLMGRIGYDVVTFGNHEFDKGMAFLQNSMDYVSWRTICANFISNTPDIATTKGYTFITTPDGAKIFFSGVVTNYDNGHPDGNHSTFTNVTFPDPMEKADEAIDKAKNKGDLKVLLSHMSHQKDFVYAERGCKYDIIISGHSHAVVDTLINGTLIGQTGKNLKMVGATYVTFKGHKVQTIEYQNIDLSEYAEDSEVAEMVAEIESNPLLAEVVGTLGYTLDKIGNAKMTTAAIKEQTGTDIAIYHYGGIRLSNYSAGEITLGKLYENEPFNSKVYTMDITKEQLANIIMLKFNDTKNTKESHRIDIFCTEPYNIKVDKAGEAVAVELPTLKSGKMYKIAVADYIVKKYDGIEQCQNRVESDTFVVDMMKNYFAAHSPIVEFDNTPIQKIINQ